MMTRIAPASAAKSAMGDSPQERKWALSIQTFIQTFAADLADIKTFYVVPFGPTRIRKISGLLNATRASLALDFSFDHMSHDEQVDYLVLRSHVTRLLRDSQSTQVKYERAKAIGLLGNWMEQCIEFIETRHAVGRLSGRDIAATLQSTAIAIDETIDALKTQQDTKTGNDVFIQTWTIERINEIQAALLEAIQFYQGYHPVISWWVEQPWAILEPKLSALAKALEEVTGANGAGSADDIVGQPVGRSGLIEELEAEWIPYNPEELVRIGETEFQWCEKEFKLAAQALGYHNPKDALEHVRNTFVEPGDQIYVVRDLADEAIAYVEKHNLITVPVVAKECWQTTMMTPARQKINPFFLGGERIIVSYPTNTMSHEDKLMSMRGNNPAFSRSTVHHELIPGHHLQYYYMDRYRPYRKLFETAFWIEGWALYWEFLLWQRGFPADVDQKWATNEAENRIGMLFWRMHRCARIIFSVKFHLGQMTPKECIDLLVERVGHERATAEGEVRRSFAGEYPPLYQAGYMLGALQLWELRRELVEDTQGPRWGEKQFHDAIMRENILPIEMLRAVLKKEKLSVDQKPSWKFYSKMNPGF